MKIIATVSETDIRNLDKYDTDAVDILEIRLDLCSEKFLAEQFSDSLADWKGSLLFTYRNPEDSSIKDQYTHRKDFIEKFLEKFNSEKNYLDIDMKRDHGFFLKFENSNYKIIYSIHNFDGNISFREMKVLYSEMKARMNADTIFKFAAFPKSVSETVVFLASVQAFSRHEKVIGIAMGAEGMYSRIFADRFGSCMTYCCLDEPKAPGQIKALDLKRIRILSGLDS